MFPLVKVLQRAIVETASSLGDYVDAWDKSAGVDTARIRDIAERMCGLKGDGGVPIKDRKYRLRSYPSCFVGSDAVMWLIQNKIVKNVRDAVVLGARMQRLNIFTKLTGSGSFENGDNFYQFCGNYRLSEYPTESDEKRLNLLKSDLLRIISDLMNSDTAFDATSKKKKSGGWSVSGEDLVNYFVSMKVSASARDAVLLGNLMVKHALITHVNETQAFRNSRDMYKFVELPDIATPAQSKKSSGSVKMDWEFVQSFGDDNALNDVEDADDLVTAVEFDRTGEHLAIGDKAGRISIVQETFAAKPIQLLEYRFYTEFQSHDPEFDSLKSVEIEPRINAIRWLPRGRSGLMLLSTNDKTVKLWRVQARRAKLRGIYSEEKESDVGESITTTARRQYRGAHSFNIHSLSVNADSELFLSADDLRINIWNLDNEQTAFTVVDLKPNDPNEIDELITTASFHPLQSNLLVHGSSKGLIRLGDLRERALLDRNAQCLFSKPVVSKASVAEITTSVLDLKFSGNGRYLVSRDYMTLRVWDINKTDQPVRVVHVHPHLTPKLTSLFENEIIFDQFHCAMSPDARTIATGTYNNCFFLHNMSLNHSVTVKARDDLREPEMIREVKVTSIGGQPESVLDKISTAPQDYRRKVLKVAWHPRCNAFAAAGLYKLYLYQSRTRLEDSV